MKIALAKRLFGEVTVTWMVIFLRVSEICFGRSIVSQKGDCTMVLSRKSPLSLGESRQEYVPSVFAIVQQRFSWKACFIASVSFFAERGTRAKRRMVPERLFQVM